MSEVVMIAGVIGYVVTVALFLYAFDRLMKENRRQEDLLLERIQRPDWRPIHLDSVDDAPDMPEHSDLDEMAAVGAVNPLILTRNDGGS
jgi:hypothetical protein